MKRVHCRGSDLAGLWIKTGKPRILREGVENVS